MMRNPGWTLVHGVPTGCWPIEGVRYGHAWAELEDAELGWIVFDPSASVNQGKDRHLFFRSYYYWAGRIGYTRRYSFGEMHLLLRETGVYGPWDGRIQKAACKRRTE